MIMSDVNDLTLAEMDTLVEEGVTDFKLFTAYPGVFYSDDGAIFQAMQRTARNGGTILMHAENGMAIDVVAADLVAAGKTDPYYHGVARYPIFEGEATNRVIRLAEAAGVPVYIVHLSARDALDEVRAARDRGSPASPKRARSTSSCPSTTWATASTEPSSSALPRCDRPITRPCSGRVWSRTTCRWFRPTTVLSTSTTRSSSALATSGKCRMGCRESRTGST